MVESKTEWDDWEFEAFLLYSSKGNNQFIRLPYKMLKRNLCSFLDGKFTSHGVPEKLASASDFPLPQGNVSLCTLYKRVCGTCGSEDFLKRNQEITKVFTLHYFLGNLHNKGFNGWERRFRKISFTWLL